MRRCCVYKNGKSFAVFMSIKTSKSFSTDMFGVGTLSADGTQTAVWPFWRGTRQPPYPLLHEGRCGWRPVRPPPSQPQQPPQSSSSSPHPTQRNPLLHFLYCDLSRHHLRGQRSPAERRHLPNTSLIPGTGSSLSQTHPHTQCLAQRDPHAQASVPKGGLEFCQARGSPPGPTFTPAWQQRRTERRRTGWHLHHWSWRDGREQEESPSLPV